mgnify:CR=1 FL=1
MELGQSSNEAIRTPPIAGEGLASELQASLYSNHRTDKMAPGATAFFKGLVRPTEIYVATNRPGLGDFQ